MPPTNSASRISLSLPGLPHDLNVLKFDGHEAISQPYRFVIDVVSRQADLDPESFLHQPAYLENALIDPQRQALQARRQD